MPARDPSRAGRPLQVESTVTPNAGDPGAERRTVRYGDSDAPKQDICPQLARNFLSRRVWSRNCVGSLGGRILAARVRFSRSEASAISGGGGTDNRPECFRLGPNK